MSTETANTARFILRQILRYRLDSTKPLDSGDVRWDAAQAIAIGRMTAHLDAIYRDIDNVGTALFNCYIDDTEPQPVYVALLADLEG